MNKELQALYEQDQAELSFACREQEVPLLEAIQVGDQPAILLRSADAPIMQLFLRIGDAYYLVGGQVALDVLLRLATSIP
jgi:hypothetical protein